MTEKIFMKKLSTEDLKKILDWHCVGLRSDRMYKLQLHDIDFTNADLTGTDFRVASFVNCIFNNADFTGANLTGAEFHYCDIRGTIFKNADLYMTRFYYCNMRDAQISSTGNWRAVGCMGPSEPYRELVPEFVGPDTFDDINIYDWL